MHHKYHTEGLILGGLPTAEANKFMFIFTRDLGLIAAHVQGVRHNHSKLRFSLQDFSLSHISLVHGKSGWKIVGATPRASWFGNFKDNPSKLYVCAQTISFLRKLVRGEERDEELFEIVRGAMEFLYKEDLSYQEIGTLQCLIMFRILDRLGYIAKTAEFTLLLQNGLWSKNVLTSLKTRQKEALESINKAIKESHL